MTSDRRIPEWSQDKCLISEGQKSKSAAELLASAPNWMETKFLRSLDKNALLALPYIFDFWALDHQRAPMGDWRSWVILGGRGAGKTRAGAEWIRGKVEGRCPRSPGAASRVALVGETYEQVRDIMIFGESGLIACTPPDRMPRWEASRRRLVWPNGAVAQAFSASDPEALRGPQFDAAWADELAKWRRATDAWDMLQFCLRIGDDPRACVTTTPRNVPILKRLLEASSTRVTHASTWANRANLAAPFLREIMERYGDTRLGTQEIEGRLLHDVDGALWQSNKLIACRVSDCPELGRIVVAVDPPVTGNATSDTCGIVVAGQTLDRSRIVVLEDASVSNASPAGWARAVIAAYERHEADKVVAEVNQGGDLVEAVLRQVDRTVSYRAVHASRGKVTRAEPVAALYEQGRVLHLGRWDALESQMALMSVQGFQGQGSPDRVDALVWAISELVGGQPGRPGIRSL